MPARVLVYCRRPVPHLTLAMLTAELRDADLMTLAEALDLPEGEEAAVSAMWAHYRLEGAGLDAAELHWHPAHRSIQLTRRPWFDGELAETLANLPPSRAQGAQRVRAHLAETVEVVGFELGVSGSLHLGATIAEVLAFYVATQGDGVVWFYHREFASPDDRGATLWTTSVPRDQP